MSKGSSGLLVLPQKYKKEVEGSSGQREHDPSHMILKFGILWTKEEVEGREKEESWRERERERKKQMEEKH